MRNFLSNLRTKRYAVKRMNELAAINGKYDAKGFVKARADFPAEVQLEAHYIPPLAGSKAERIYRETFIKNVPNGHELQLTF